MTESGAYCVEGRLLQRRYPSLHRCLQNNEAGLKAAEPIGEDSDAPVLDALGLHSITQNLSQVSMHFAMAASRTFTNTS